MWIVRIKHLNDWISMDRNLRVSICPLLEFLFCRSFSFFLFFSLLHGVQFLYIHFCSASAGSSLWHVCNKMEHWKMYFLCCHLYLIIQRVHWFSNWAHFTILCNYIGLYFLTYHRFLRWLFVTEPEIRSFHLWNISFEEYSQTVMQLIMT